MSQFSTLKKLTSYAAHFVRVVFPNGTLALFEGSGQETLPGIGTFKGEDPDWGQLGTLNLGDLTSGAVTTGFTFSVKAGPELLEAARSPASLGAKVEVWSAEIHPVTGPQDVTLARTGYVNLLPIQHGLFPTIDVEVSLAIDFVGDPDEGLDLSDAAQRRIDPTDRFCEFMFDVDRTLPWGGKDTARPFLQGSVSSGTSWGLEFSDLREGMER